MIYIVLLLLLLLLLLLTIIILYITVQSINAKGRKKSIYDPITNTTTRVRINVVKEAVLKYIDFMKLNSIRNIPKFEGRWKYELARVAGPKVPKCKSFR